jgi:hypothetical protein
MKKKAPLTTKEMCRQNIIAVKVDNQLRIYKRTLGGTVTKTIRRTRYLKICWMCGSSYESFKSNSYACSTRCSNNLGYARRMGNEAPARMEVITKDKNVKDLKDKMGY